MPNMSEFCGSKAHKAIESCRSHNRGPWVSGPQGQAEAGLHSGCTSQELRPFEPFLRRSRYLYVMDFGFKGLFD